MLGLEIVMNLDTLEIFDVIDMIRMETANKRLQPSS